MSSLVKVDVPLPQTSPDDPRVGHLLGTKLADGENPALVIVGFPCDEGVRRNGGRPGAAASPLEIRRWLYRATPDARAAGPFTDIVEHTRDVGDLRVTGDLDADQMRLAEVVAPHLDRGSFVMVLGGGHETAFGHFLGYVRARKQVWILNWDAHPDVRELHEGRGHSGSPFRQALEHPSGICSGYRVAGLLPQSAAAAHVSYVERRGRAYFRDQLSPAAVTGIYDSILTRSMVTFDIDAVDQSQAPGVSAPSTGGLSADLWLDAAYQAGRCAHVTSCDVVELNPAFDRDGQTARLAAMTVWQVIRGLAAR